MEIALARSNTVGCGFASEIFCHTEKRLWQHFKMASMCMP